MYRYSEHRRESLTERPQFQVLHKTQWRHTVPRPSPHDKARLWQSIYTRGAPDLPNGCTAARAVARGPSW